MLKVVRDLRGKIKTQQQRLRRLKDYRSRLSQELDGLPQVAQRQSRLENLTVAIVDCERLINHLTLICIECSAELCGVIDKLVLDDNQKAVLIERYVFGKSFGAIGKELGYSETHVYRLHQDALNVFNR